jgi:predicted ester cyclase
MVSSQFDVTKKSVIMGVSEGGKIVQRPVIVTTIVAQ